MPTVTQQRLARQDLLGIWLFTCEAWGEAQADQYLGDLDAKFQLLANNPRMSPERTEFQPPVRICHHARHLIVYREAEGGIDIVRVLHDRMELSEHLSYAKER